MRIAYKLTQEEFAEIYTDSWPKPNSIAVVITVAFAIILGVFGFLLTRALGTEEWSVQLSFWVLPLMLAGFAIWEQKFHPKQSRVNMEKEVRSRYDRLYSREQTLTFDQEKWSHETEGVRLELYWSALLIFIEWPSVIALLAKDQFVVIPKRIFTEDELGLLRRSMLQIRGTRHTFHTSFWDWMRTSYTMLWEETAIGMLLGNAIGLVCLGLLIQHLGSPSKPVDFFWGEVLCAFVLFVIVTAQFWYFGLQYMISRDGLRLPFEAEFSERGMWVRRAKVEFFRAWPMIRKFQENRNCFLLYTSPNDFSLFSKSTLSLEQQGALRELMRAKVAAE